MNHNHLFGFIAAAGLLVATSAYTQAAAPTSGYGIEPVSADPALPQTPGAVGDQQRHYYFKEAAVEMPYRLYVPENYDPKVPTPLVVALHGYSGNQNYFFQFADDLPAQLKAHGFIFVAPMGYNRGSWFGNGGPATRGDGAVETSKMIVKNGLSVTELGEMDVMNVVKIVQSEYNTDPNRTYLMGHSMGGTGAWHIGQKYVNLWAAVAPMSGTGRFSTIDNHVMAKVPVMVAVGGAEADQLEPSKTAVKEINAAGGTAVYLELEGQGHVPMIRPATPKILEFFAQHRKRK